MFVFVDRTLDPPSEFLEPIKRGQLKEHVDAEYDVLRFFRIPLSGKEKVIEEVSEHQNGEIQGWKIVVNVGDTTHDEERGEMEEPPKERDLPNVEEMVPFTRFHVNIFPLLPEQVKPEEEHCDEQADSRSLPDQRCTDEVVLDLLVAPTAHAKSKVLEWPIERRRRQDVELIRVRYQSVVGRHHGNVEVPKVAKEG